MGTDALIINVEAQQFTENIGFEEIDRVVGYRMTLCDMKKQVNLDLHEH